MKRNRIVIVAVVFVVVAATLFFILQQIPKAHSDTQGSYDSKQTCEAKTKKPCRTRIFGCGPAETCFDWIADSPESYPGGKLINPDLPIDSKVDGKVESKVEDK